MNRTLKQIISVLAAIFLLLVMYYGSYVPFHKSAEYIDTVQSLQSISSVQQLEDAFSPSLNISSPIGQEELVRNLGSIVTGLISNNGTAHPEVVQPLMSYLTMYYNPIIARGHGMSFGQDLYVMGTAEETAFNATHTASYLQAAQSYFQEGLSQAPKRPQFLYGLMAVYQAEGNNAQAAVEAKTILTYWPSDTQTQQLLLTLEATTTPSTGG